MPNVGPALAELTQDLVDSGPGLVGIGTCQVLTDLAIISTWLRPEFGKLRSRAQPTLRCRCSPEFRGRSGPESIDSERSPEMHQAWGDAHVLCTECSILGGRQGMTIDWPAWRADCLVVFLMCCCSCGSHVDRLPSARMRRYLVRKVVAHTVGDPNFARAAGALTSAGIIAHFCLLCVLSARCTVGLARRGVFCPEGRLLRVAQAALASEVGADELPDRHGAGAQGD